MLVHTYRSQKEKKKTNLIRTLGRWNLSVVQHLYAALISHAQTHATDPVLTAILLIQKPYMGTVIPLFWRDDYKSVKYTHMYRGEKTPKRT